MIEALLRKAVARALDATMFDAVALDDSRPAGLLNGVAPIVGHPGGDAVARKVDLVALTDAVSAVSFEIILIMHPSRILSLVLDGVTGLDVIPSAYISPDAVIAIAPQALAVLGGGVEIDASIESVVHMSDIALPIVAGATADPVRSAWQTDAIATRLILDAGWTMQASGAVAWASGVSW